MAELKKRYGLVTAICMVVGIVIGSGVFFKAEKILTVTGGDVGTAIFAWACGGCIMIICAYAFSVMAGKYRKINGLVDYGEAVIGEKFAFFIGWFNTTIYLPSLTMTLAWLSARYFGELFGWSMTGPEVMLLSGLMIIGSFTLNVLSPKMAGRFQVSTTAIKLVPLLLMGIVGVAVGLKNGTLVENFTAAPTLEQLQGVLGADYQFNSSPLFTALCATAFAYEGWIVATSINAEIKDAKKNLPRALIIGSLSIVVIYILYYLGISGSVKTTDLLQHGAMYAFQQTFGETAGVIITVFIAISCMGTLNGLVLGCSRSAYSLAVRKEGFAPHIFSQLDEKTNVPTNSAFIGMLFSILWLVYFYGSNFAATPWFGPIRFDPTELPVITLFAFYFPVYIGFMIKGKGFSTFKRIIAQGLAAAGSIFMIVASVFSHGVENVLWYLLVFAVIMIIGIFFMRKKKK